MFYPFKSLSLNMFYLSSFFISLISQKNSVMTLNFSAPKTLILLFHSRIFFSLLLTWLRAKGGLVCLGNIPSSFLPSFPRSSYLCCRKEKSDWKWQVFHTYFLVNTDWLLQMPLCCLPLTSVGPGGISTNGGLDTLCLNIKKLYIKLTKY